MKEKIKADVKQRELYRYYKEKYGRENISYKMYSEIIQKFNKALIDNIIYNNFEFHLPGRLGTLRIKKIKIQVKLNKDGTIDKRKLIPDWKETKKLWESDPEAKESKQLVYHLNRHTNGYRHKFFWNRRNSNVKNQVMYDLDMARYTVKRKLAAALKNKELNLNYYE